MRETVKTKLDYLAETKSLIKSALIEKGQEVADGDDFRSYADKISAISGGASGGGNAWEVLPNIPAKLSAVPYNSFVFNNHIYVVFGNADTSVNEIWRLDDDGWKYFSGVPRTSGCTTGRCYYVEFNGELHLITYGYKSYHYKYDFNAGAWVEITTIEAPEDYKTAWVCSSGFYIFAGSKGTDLYKFDGTAWNLIKTSAISKDITHYVCVKDDKVYYTRDYKNLYSFDPTAGTETVIADLSSSGLQLCRIFAVGDALYFVDNGYGSTIYKYADGQFVDLEMTTLTSNTYNTSCVLNGKLFMVGTGTTWAGYRLGCACALA